MFSVVLLASSMLNLSSAAPAPVAQEDAVPGWLVNFVVQGSPPKLEEAQRRAVIFFDQATNGSGVASGEAFKAREETMRAQRRSMILSGMLQKDLDGDGAVTKEELDIYYTPVSRQMLRTTVGINVMPTKEQQAEILQKAEEKDFSLDTNSDGRITFDEMLQDANKKLDAERQGIYQGPLASDKLMTLDGNSDGVVTREEYLGAVARAYRLVDTNGDGSLSKEEIRAALLKFPASK